MTETPRGKVFDPMLREETLRIVARSDLPIGVSDVVRKLQKIGRKVAWATARSILLDLAREGRLTMMRTSSNVIFWTEKQELAAPMVQEAKAG
jgi:Fe2+ or Zn2+ uptake regulation protein